MSNRSVTQNSSRIFNALADPTRRSILELLCLGAQPAGRIARAFPVSRPAISRHLRMLRGACLVKERREGRNRLYELDAEPLKSVDTWLNRYRVFWNASLLGLKAYLEEETTGPVSSSRLRTGKQKRRRSK